MSSQSQPNFVCNSFCRDVFDIFKQWKQPPNNLVADVLELPYRYALTFFVGNFPSGDVDKAFARSGSSLADIMFQQKFCDWGPKLRDRDCKSQTHILTSQPLRPRPVNRASCAELSTIKRLRLSEEVNG